MNTENILKLAALLRSQAEQHFNMQTWLSANREYLGTNRPIGKLVRTCGTTACIAGWAVVMDKPDAEFLSYGQTVYSIPNMAREILGLEVDLSADLFSPDHYMIDYKKVTNEVAADVLEHLAETGEVVWPPEVQTLEYMIDLAARQAIKRRG